MITVGSMETPYKLVSFFESVRRYRMTYDFIGGIQVTAEAYWNRQRLDHYSIQVPPFDLTSVRAANSAQAAAAPQIQASIHRATASSGVALGAPRGCVHGQHHPRRE